MARFSKAKMVQDLLERAKQLEEKWKFDRNNGWAQLRDGNIERAAEYGRYRNMLDLAAEIEDGYIGA